MARVVDKEARRAGIVAAANRVFAERGVARATVADIVRSAGVAQGTFYLYFASKDELVLAVAEEMVQRLIDGIRVAASANGASAVEKLLALGRLLGGVESSPDSRELVELLHRPENRTLHDRLAEQITPRLVPLVESIVEQGVAEDLFHVADTSAAAWFVLGGLRSTELAGTPIREMPAALEAATALALRALGCPSQS